MHFIESYILKAPGATRGTAEILFLSPKTVIWFITSSAVMTRIFPSAHPLTIGSSPAVELSYSISPCKLGQLFPVLCHPCYMSVWAFDESIALAFISLNIEVSLNFLLCATYQRTQLSERFRQGLSHRGWPAGINVEQTHFVLLLLLCFLNCKWCGKYWSIF